MPTLPRSGPLTLEDFEAIREVDDGHRYELIDGVLVVTPSPVPLHQQVVFQIGTTLAASLPRGYRMYVAPLDIRLGPNTVVQPDVLVVSAGCVTPQGIKGTPILAVEVLSQSTRHFDLGLKLSRYEAAGCPAYWVFNPDEPSMRAWALRDGRYVEVAHATGDEPATLTLPWPMRIVPSDLVMDPP